MNIIPHFSDKTYSKFIKFFDEYKKVMTKPTFYMFIMSITCVVIFDRVQSIKYIYEHFIAMFFPAGLNSIYYFFGYSEISIEAIITATIRTVLRHIPEPLKAFPVYIIIDDTLVPKFGTHFDCYMKHFDHCKRNNSSYLMGHSFVCICLSIPIKKMDNGDVRYITIPVGIRLYSKTETKLQLASSLIKSAMNYLSDAKVILLCDSWYSKGEILETVEAFDNLEFFGAVRFDTALFELPGEYSGKGRPRVRGERIDLEKLTYHQEGEYFVAKQTVVTRLFSKAVIVFVTVKDVATLSSLRLFICTSDMPFSMEAKDKTDPSKNTHFIRWNVEVLFYELKTFWSFCQYMLRNMKSIEVYTNILCAAFCAVTLMPFSNNEMESLQFSSPQESKACLADAIKREVILCSFAKSIENTKMYTEIQDLLSSFMLQKRFYQ
jgi:hypothetical protein